MVYEERIVCFVDLLGFGELVNSTNIKPKDSSENIRKKRSLAKEIKKLFDYMSIEKMKNREFYTIPEDIKKKLNSNLPEGDLEGALKIAKEISKGKPALEYMNISNIHDYQDLTMTQFSDSIVISCNSERYVSFIRILRIFSYLQKKILLDFNLLIRGGVTIGSISHTDKEIFGPAMNRSYELESKFAIYPRIIIDKKVDRNFIDYNLNDLVDSYSIIEESNDGFYELNLKTAFKHTIAFEGKENGSEVLAFKSALEKVKELEEEYRDKKVHPKYSWLLTKLESFERELPLMNYIND